jgi:hypothetical protein
MHTSRASTPLTVATINCTQTLKATAFLAATDAPPTNLDRTISNIHTPAEAGQIKGIVQCLPKITGANGEKRIKKSEIVNFFAHADELGLVQAVRYTVWSTWGALEDATRIIDGAGVEARMRATKEHASSGVDCRSLPLTLSMLLVSQH